MNREQWIEVTYLELIRRHGQVEDDLSGVEKNNIREWAEGLAESYFDEDPSMSPNEAIDEEVSCG